METSYYEPSSKPVIYNQFGGLYLEENCCTVLWAGCGGHPPAMLLYRGWQGSVLDVRFGYSGNLMYIAQYYTDHVLPQVLEHQAKSAPIRRRSRLLLHHDNDAPHKARLTVQFLEQQGITLFPHPPYSPDLASCDFGFFKKIKGAIAGKLFHHIQDLARAVNSELRGISASEYHDCFMKW
ncbi:Histone-lysine N-methyltransferase SETMAR [Portunus trituberculatus]|uniref:Histone-lysine N-methyltransferase SETMAR n=1 Tax=Portunus trituberculatus TaxID=210409 RepID=A0A5B7EH45_PORTR|nr:Histone-lysine N-methyltransferase SETMAR [Portunus trituberculatus]